MAPIGINSGCERLRFPALDSGRGGCYFEPESGCGTGVSGAWVFVYGNDTLSVWNMDSLNHATLPVASSSNGGGALISPDGRYLVVSRSAVRVWDLTNLPSDLSARTPIATYGVGNNAVISTRFVDDTTLEVITRTATGTATTRYDVATGKRSNNQRLPFSGAGNFRDYLLIAGIRPAALGIISRYFRSDSETVYIVRSLMVIALALPEISTS